METQISDIAIFVGIFCLGFTSRVNIYVKKKYILYLYLNLFEFNKTLLNETRI